MEVLTAACGSMGSVILPAVLDAIENEPGKTRDSGGVEKVPKQRLRLPRDSSNRLLGAKPAMT